jgi:N-acetylglucosaminyldiphosphoundecaprenol N-acetyl-beta-D-mannosaminyltransferase
METPVMESATAPVKSSPINADHAHMSATALNGHVHGEQEAGMNSVAVSWPRKFDVFGVGVSAVTYDEVEQKVLAAAKQRQSATVTHMSSHGLTMAAKDAKFREVINSFDIAAPDGQPVRWALNWFHKAKLPDRCYGPEMMIRLCRAAAKQGVSIYLYGSSNDVLEKLSSNLKKECLGLVIAGVESPPFRALTPQETDEAIQRINDSGAGIVFIGLGCPRQDVFAAENKHKIKAVQSAVGAAFDFHAGTKSTAPAWMQRRGLEWFYRLTQEPGRLWKRYLSIHTTYAFLLTRRLILGR